MNPFHEPGSPSFVLSRTGYVSSRGPIGCTNPLSVGCSPGCSHVSGVSEWPYPYSAELFSCQTAVPMRAAHPARCAAFLHWFGAERRRDQQAHQKRQGHDCQGQQRGQHPRLHSATSRRARRTAVWSFSTRHAKGTRSSSGIVWPLLSRMLTPWPGVQSVKIAASCTVALGPS